MIVFVGVSSLSSFLELGLLNFLSWISYYLYLSSAFATIKRSLIRRLDLYYAV